MEKEIFEIECGTYTIVGFEDNLNQIRLFKNDGAILTNKDAVPRSPFEKAVSILLEKSGVENAELKVSKSIDNKNLIFVLEDYEKITLPTNLGLLDQNNDSYEKCLKRIDNDNYRKLNYFKNKI